MKYSSKSKYVDLVWDVYDNKICGYAYFKDLSEVSAIHIHSNLPTMPILVWIASSQEWENGVAQATPLSNAPCCFIRKGDDLQTLCSLKSPYHVPNTKFSSFTSSSFCVELEPCLSKDCDWKKNDFVINVHGYNFASVGKSGCPDSLKPGADVISSETVKIY